jgi:hypothetical protein
MVEYILSENTEGVRLAQSTGQADRRALQRPRTSCSSGGPTRGVGQPRACMKEGGDNENEN